MRIINSGVRTAQEQMQQDVQLLEGISEPVLRFYQFLPEAITYGHFINPLDWLKGVSEETARRPTGGGLIFHEEDFSFTLAVPVEHPLAKLPTLERYQLLNDQLRKSVDALVPRSALALKFDGAGGGIDQLCMANPTEYDLLWEQKKIAGAAQRKNRHVCIHQCSLFLREPDWDRIATNLIDPQYVIPKFRECTGALFQGAVPDDFRNMLQQKLYEKFSEIFSFL